MKYYVALFIGFLTFGCSKKVIQTTSEAPPSMEYEMELTRSPLTGDVPSHKLFEAMASQIGTNLKTKFEKVYPNTWRPVDDQFASLSISKITFDPNNTQTYYFCTGEGWFNADASRGAGVWKSTDAGETWQQLSSTTTEDFYYCQDILVHPVTSDVYVTTRDNGVMRSQDGGSTWVSVLNNSNGAKNNRAADLEITADNKIVVSIGVFSTDGIYLSSTGNEGDWQFIMNGIPTSGIERIELATAPSDAQVMYAATQNGNNNRIEGFYRSVDQGANWVRISNPGGDDQMAKQQAWFDLIIEVDPNDPNTVATGGLNIWRTKDAGETWQQLTEGDLRVETELQYVHVDQHDIIFLDSDTVYFLNDGGIYRCDEFTQDTPRIYNMGLNYNTTQFYTLAVYPHTDDSWVMGGTQDNGTQASTVEGVGEYRKVSWADGSFCAIDYENTDYLYSTTQFRRVFRTYRDKVDTITNPGLVNENTRFVNPLIMDASDPTVLYQASNVGVWALPNARTATENDWKRICRPIGVVTALATSKNAPNTVYFGRINTPYRIDNSHQTDIMYLPVPLDRNEDLPSEGYLISLVPDDLDKEHMVAIYSNYDIESVWQTKDAYADDPTWVSCEGNLPNIPIRWGCFENGSSDRFYVATELGVYFTDNLDGENTVWKRNSENLPNIKVNMIESRESDNLFVAATHGRGMYTGYADENGIIQWEERGPTNVGGRSRGLMIDPNVTSNKKVWTGSVSGGLWVVNNIDSSRVYIEVPESVQISAYPNPVQDELNLAFNEANPESVTIKVYNSIGQMVKQLSLESRAFYTLSLSGLTNGVLYVQIEQGEEQEVLKIIKAAF